MEGDVEFHAISGLELHWGLIFVYQTTLLQVYSPFLVEMTVPYTIFLSPRYWKGRESMAPDFSDPNLLSCFGGVNWPYENGRAPFESTLA